MLQRQLRPALVMTVLMTILTGLLYPLAVTAIAKSAFPHQAEGSLIERDGRVIGSELIGQSFSDPKHVWGRPSATSPISPRVAITSTTRWPSATAFATRSIRGWTCDECDTGNLRCRDDAGNRARPADGSGMGDANRESAGRHGGGPRRAQAAGEGCRRVDGPDGDEPDASGGARGPWDELEWLACRDGKARLLLLPGLGHVPHLEAPEKTLPPLVALLKEGV